MAKDCIKPADLAQLQEALSNAHSAVTPLTIKGNGTFEAIGRPVETPLKLDLSALSGLLLYEPEELVMSARAATPLRDINLALSQVGQELAFEPPDLAPLFGKPAGSGTIGGLFSAGFSGPRRLKSGAARDHVMGYAGFNGRAEAYKAGGRVMKNVTGFDMTKLMVGAWGTLGILTEINFRTLPVAEDSLTLLVLGRDLDQAVEAMSTAMGTANDVSGAAHLPQDLARTSQVQAVARAADGITALRLEGPTPSIRFRVEALKPLLSRFGELVEIGHQDTRTLWKEIADVAPFVATPQHALWRLSVAPPKGSLVASQLLDQLNCRLFLDWAGGKIWLELASGDPHEAVVRDTLAGVGGHATLIRAAHGLRATTPVFQPQPAALSALSRRIKAAFDPLHLFNPGRMYEGF